MDFSSLPQDNQPVKASALSNKITAILSASYADLDIRDALQVLDSRHVKNSAETRRNLRLDLYKEVIETNGNVVDDFGAVAEQLRNVGEAVAGLKGLRDSLKRNISIAHTEVAPVLLEADELLGRKTQIDTRQSLLQGFSKHFLLTETELAILTSSAEPVNEIFFEVLERAKTIHRDSQALLGGENQRLGLEVLDQSSKNIEAGFSKLHRWIQREFKEALLRPNSSLDIDATSINATIRRALRTLAERPSLFQSSLETFAKHREQALGDAFYTALTGSSEGELRTKPIEFSAQDPLRYVGDMLAWTHATTVSEKESLEGLFLPQIDDRIKSLYEPFADNLWESKENNETEPLYDGTRALAQLINHSLSSVANLLRGRIEQVMKTHEEPILAYKLANLIAFYQSIFARLLNGNSEGFPAFLSSLKQTAFEHFRTVMQYKVSAVQSEHQMISSSLDAPEFLQEALTTLQQLLQSFDASVVTTDAKTDALHSLFTTSLEPFLAICEKMSRKALSKDLERSIFILNCLLTAKTSLELSTTSNIYNEDILAYVRGKTSDLDEAILDHQMRLQAAQHTYLLEESGLAVQVSAISKHVMDSTQAGNFQSTLERQESLDKFLNEETLQSLATQPSLSISALMDTSQKLDSMLPSAQIDVGGLLERVSDKSLAGKVTNIAIESFIRDFELVEYVVERLDSDLDRYAGQMNMELASQEENAGDTTRPKDAFPRTVDELRILLA